MRAGCDTESVLDALGLEWGDLFEDLEQHRLPRRGRRDELKRSAKFEKLALTAHRDLVLHRNLDLGPDIDPWQVPRTKQSPELAAALKEHCGPEEPEPWVLRHAQQLAGVAIQRLARLDVRPEASLALQDHAGSPRWLGPDDLRQVVEKVRASVLAEFGPDADRP